MDLYSQIQLGLTTSVFEKSRFGSTMLRGAASFYGVGLALEIGYQRDNDHDSLVHVLGLEFRPLATAQTEAFKYFDPYVGFAAELGVGTPGLWVDGRASAGFDVNLIGSEDVHPALTARYDYRVFDTTSEFARHGIHVGIAVRAAF